MKQKMRKSWFLFLSCFVGLSLIIAPDVSAKNLLNDEMTLLKTNMPIATTRRHENYPCVNFNPITEEFIATWWESGKRTDDDLIGYHSVQIQRLSTDGELIDGPVEISPPEPGFKAVITPQLPYNPFNNEYIVPFSAGPSFFFGQNYYVDVIDPMGNILAGPKMVYFTPKNSSHPLMTFNPNRREYFGVCRDTFLNKWDFIGFILDETGDLIKGPFVLVTQPGVQPTGSASLNSASRMLNILETSAVDASSGFDLDPDVAYSPVDDVYLLVYEDNRHHKLWAGPCDAYGLLVSGEGEIITDIPILDDYGLVDKDGNSLEGGQDDPLVTYNSDLNEFLVVFADERKIWDHQYAGLVGQIVKTDGKLKGKPFVISEYPAVRGFHHAIYVPEKKEYFVVWADERKGPDLPFLNEEGEGDIYARWIKSNGAPKGPEIPICLDDGNQVMPRVDYDPETGRFLIIYHDFVSNDFPQVAIGPAHFAEMPGELKGALYGTP